jgi:hypothetical protein
MTFDEKITTHESDLYVILYLGTTAPAPAKIAPAPGTVRIALDNTAPASAKTVSASMIRITVMLEGFLRFIKLPHLIPDSVTSTFFIVCPMTRMMMFIVVLSIFIVQVWSQTITVNTTSGRLLGTQADGGVSSLYALLTCSPQVIHRTSGILQGNCKIPNIARLD